MKQQNAVSCLVNCLLLLLPTVPTITFTVITYQFTSTYQSASRYLDCDYPLANENESTLLQIHYINSPEGVCSYTVYKKRMLQ